MAVIFIESLEFELVISLDPQQLVSFMIQVSVWLYLQKFLSEVGFEPTPTFVDQKALCARIQASLRLSLAP